MTIHLLDVYEGQGIRAGALEFLYELMKERDADEGIRAFLERRDPSWARKEVAQ